MSNLEADWICDPHLDERVGGLKRVSQGCSIYGRYCAACGFMNPKPLRKESDMSEDEKILFDWFKSTPRFKAREEIREFIPVRSDLKVWCSLCTKCYKDRPVTWRDK